MDAGDIANGRLSFEKALRAREAQSTRYKIGFAAKKSGDFRAAVQALKIVAFDQTDNKGRWVEASWLEMLEANLLLGNFSDAYADAPAAVEILSGARYEDFEVYNSIYYPSREIIHRSGNCLGKS